MNLRRAIPISRATSATTRAKSVSSSTSTSTRKTSASSAANPARLKKATASSSSPPSPAARNASSGAAPAIFRLPKQTAFFRQNSDHFREFRKHFAPHLRSFSKQHKE